VKPPQLRHEGRLHDGMDHGKGEDADEDHCIPPAAGPLTAVHCRQVAPDSSRDPSHGHRYHNGSENFHQLQLLEVLVSPQLALLLLHVQVSDGVQPANMLQTDADDPGVGHEQEGKGEDEKHC